MILILLAVLLYLVGIIVTPILIGYYDPTLKLDGSLEDGTGLVILGAFFWPLLLICLAIGKAGVFLIKIGKNLKK